MPMLFASIVKQPSTNVPPCASVSTKRVVTPVPSHARKTFFSLAIVLLGFTVFTPTMLAGAALGNAFALGDLLLVILIGSVILGAYVALLGWIGARTGLTTVVMARYSLGMSGSKLASIRAAAGPSTNASRSRKLYS